MAGEFTSINNPQGEVTFINNKFMSDLLLATQMVQFCTPPDAQGKNKGDAVRFLQFPEWTTNTTEVDQTTGAPSANKIDISGVAGQINVDGTLKPYGGFVEVSQFALDTMKVGTMEKIAKRAADAGARGLDTLCMTAASGTTNIYRAGTGAAICNSGAILAGETLKAVDISYVGSFLDSKGNDGFDHIAGMYGAVLHTGQGSQLRTEPATSSNVPTYSQTHQFTDSVTVEKGDLKSLYNVKLLTSPLCYTGLVDAVSCYTGFAIAKDGLGCSEVQGQGDARARVIIKTPGPNTVSQPLDTQNTIAWAWAGCFLLLDSQRVVKIVSAVS